MGVAIHHDTSVGPKVFGGLVLLVAGSLLLVFRRRLRALNSSLTRNEALVLLSTYLIPALFVVVGVVLLVSAAR